MNTNPSFSPFQKLVIFISILALILWLLKSLLHLLVPLFLAMFLAYIFKPIVNWFESKGISRIPGTIILYLASFSIIIILLSILIPIFSNEFFSLQEKLPEYLSTIYNKLWAWQEGIQSKYIIIKEFNLLSKTIGTLQENIFGSAENFYVLLQNIFTWFYAFFLMPFYMFFILADGPKIKKQFLLAIPNKYFEAAANLFFRVDKQLGSYIRGILLDSAVIGTLSVIGLFIFKVKFFFIIGIFAGLANLIPYFGPVAGAVPAILITVLEKGSVSSALWIVALFCVIQLIDNAIVQPLVLARSVKIHPIFVLLAILVGGRWFGIWGMFFAVPLVGISKVIIVEVSKEIRFRLSEA